MSTLEQALDTLREATLLGHRVERLTRTVEKLEVEQSRLRDRVTRIEALIEFSRAAAVPATLPPERTGDAIRHVGND